MHVFSMYPSIRIQSLLLPRRLSLLFYRQTDKFQKLSLPHSNEQCDPWQTIQCKNMVESRG
jgi:hypothetical protein